jgi:hypothetical protein
MPPPDKSDLEPITQTPPRRVRIHYWDGTTGPFEADRYSPSKDEDDGSIFTDQKCSREEPSTWPTLYLPFHTTAGASNPQHIDEVLRYVHYKGAGARALGNLISDALDAADNEEDKIDIEIKAYLSWPFNVTSDGYWKELSGMTEEEIEFWKEARQLMQTESSEKEETSA